MGVRETFGLNSGMIWQKKINNDILDVLCGNCTTIINRVDFRVQSKEGQPVCRNVQEGLKRLISIIKL